MNRRRFLTTTTTAIGSLSAAAALAAPNESKTMEIKGIPTANPKLTPPANGAINVAMLISDGVNVIDLSGPWGVFESVNLPNGGFNLMTVAETMEIVTSSSGLKIKPDQIFADSPAPQVVVIPAQKGSEAMREWLKKVAPTADVTMSVCTGAFHLAKAGLLNGKLATTHHEFLDRLEKQFPEVQVKRGVRFVEGEKISTAGGLTSGTDLALRVVERYFSREIAQKTADYMEYHGRGWIA